MARRIVRSAVSVVVVLLLSSGGCGPGGVFAPRCDLVTLSSPSAHPLDPIVVDGVPRRTGALFAEVTVEGGMGVMPAFVERRDDGTVILHAPFHPMDPIGGGVVNVQITDGSLGCPNVALTIEPLPAADRAFATAVDELEESLKARAGWFGITLEALRTADPGTLPAHLLPLIAADAVICDPDNPNSLRAVAEGTAPLFAEPELDILDRVVARVALADILSKEREELPNFSAGGSGDAKRRHLLQASPPVEHADIESALELNRLMSIAGVSAFGAAEESEVVELRRALSIAVGYLGVAAGPGAKAAAAGTGGALYAYNQMRQGLADLLPSRFVAGSLRLDFGPAAFLEDEAPAEGQWSNVSVEAVSNGWRLDGSVLEVIVPGDGLLDRFDAWLSRFAPPGFGDELAGFIVSDVLSVLFDLSPSAALEIEPFTWPAVDVSGEPWTVGTVVGEAIAVDSPAMTYRAAATGVGLLTVETAEGLFGSQRTQRQVEIEVRPIQVTVEPAILRVDAGETVALTARVDNAVDESVEWSAAGAGGVLDPAFSFGDGPHRVQYTTPADESLLPVTITARSISDTGLRSAPDTPERSASAVLRGAVELLVSPSSVCLEPGETQLFVAEVVGAGDEAVTWSATSGAISAAGAFSAPLGTGTAEVIATSVVDPHSRAVATVTVGGCGCFWQAVFSGDFTGTFRGSFATFSNTSVPGAGSGLAGITFRESNALSSPGGFLTASGRPRDGETGTFDNVELVFSGVDPQDTFMGGDGTTPVRLIVESHSGGRLEGRIEGTLEAPNLLDPQRPRVAQVTITVRAVPRSFGGGEVCPDASAP